DFLFRLGFRQYFPGENWEIVSTQKEVTADFDVFESPAIKVRTFAWHYGNWRDVPGVGAWFTHNRIATSKIFPEVFVLRTSHIYGAIFKDSVINSTRTRTWEASAPRVNPPRSSIRPMR